MDPEHNDLAKRYRLGAFATLEFVLHILRELNTDLGQDLDSTLIVLEVAAATNAPLLARATAEDTFADGDTPIPATAQRPITRLALSQITGIPRETVRRKIMALTAAGVLTLDGRGGVRLAPDLVQGRLMPTVATAVRRLRGYLTALERAGVIEPVRFTEAWRQA